MVEVALLLVVFLAILLGIMDWTWTMYEHESLVSRASQAARWAAVRPFNATTQSGAKDIVLYGATPCVGCAAGFGLAAGNVTVQQQNASYDVANGSPVATTHILVAVSGYTVNHWFAGGSFSGRTITASALWECLDAACDFP